MTIPPNDEEEDEDERFFGRDGEVFFPVGIPTDLMDQALLFYRTHPADEVRKLLVAESRKREILTAITHPEVGVRGQDHQDR